MEPETAPRLVEARGETLRKLEREARVAGVLREVAGALGASLELDELLDLVLGRLKDLLDAEGTMLFLLDERKRELISRVPGGETRLRLEVGEGLLGLTVRTGRLCRFSASEPDKIALPEWDDLLGITTEYALVAPLKNNLSRTIGLLLAYRGPGRGRFDDDDEEILSVLAKQSAIAIDNSRLLVTLIRKNQQLQQAQEQLTRRVRDLELLFELERATAHAHSHEELARAVLERLARACNAEGALVSLREGDSNSVQEFRLERAARRLGASEEPAVFTVSRRPSSESILAEVHGRRAPVQFERSETADEERAIGVLRSLVAEPLDGDETAVGALGVFNKRSGPFTAEDLGLLRLVSANVSTAVRLFDASREREKQERLSSIGRLLSQVVHDLKSPLTVISGYVELMRDAENREQRRDYALEILKQFQTLGAMQREVLAFARGETQVFARKVLLDRYFEEVERELRAQIVSDNIELELSIQRKLTVHFDSERITRALSNLVRNAAEAFEGRPGTIRVSAEARGEDLVLSVADDGPGVPEEVVPRLFQSFVTHGKKDGTGLGLAIVQRTALEHGGSVSLVGSERGAHFELVLPAAVLSPKGDPGKKSAPKAPPSASAPSRRRSDESKKKAGQANPSRARGDAAKRRPRAG